MRALLAAVLLSLSPLTAWAHPGVGIVRDRRGNVFYTDLVHIWRIDASGRKSIAVRDVHSHELALDSADNLYGEDNRYQGGDRYRHRIWKRSPDGRVSNVVPWTEGFWRQYGFTSDRFGAMYWVTCPDRVCAIKRRSANGVVSTVVPDRPFASQINLIAAASDGSVYLVDGGDLRKVDTVATPPAPWGPSGMLRAPNDDLWLLEYSTTNEARVRRVGRDGRSTVY